MSLNFQKRPLYGPFTWSSVHFKDCPLKGAFALDIVHFHEHPPLSRDYTVGEIQWFKGLSLGVSDFYKWYLIIVIRLRWFRIFFQDPSSVIRSRARILPIFVGLISIEFHAVQMKNRQNEPFLVKINGPLVLKVVAYSLWGRVYATFQSENLFRPIEWVSIIILMVNFVLVPVRSMFLN